MTRTVTHILNALISTNCIICLICLFVHVDVKHLKYKHAGSLVDRLKDTCKEIVELQRACKEPIAKQFMKNAGFDIDESTSVSYFILASSPEQFAIHRTIPLPEYYMNHLNKYPLNLISAFTFLLLSFTIPLIVESLTFIETNRIRIICIALNSIETVLILIAVGAVLGCLINYPVDFKDGTVDTLSFGDAVTTFPAIMAALILVAVAGILSLVNVIIDTIHYAAEKNKEKQDPKELTPGNAESPAKDKLPAKVAGSGPKSAKKVTKVPLNTYQKGSASLLPENCSPFTPKSHPESDQTYQIDTYMKKTEASIDETNSHVTQSTVDSENPNKTSTENTDQETDKEQSIPESQPDKPRRRTKKRDVEN